MMCRTSKCCIIKLAKLLFPMLAVGAAREKLQSLPEMPESGKPIRSKQPSVLSLNQVTFPDKVLQSSQSGKFHATNWIVAFCPASFEPCQQQAPLFAKLAAQWQRNLNKNLFTLEVRFATVDCAIDKVLCNEQNVDGYPTLIHYQGGESKAKWMGRGEAKKRGQELAAWIQTRMVVIIEGKIKVKEAQMKSGNDRQSPDEAPESYAQDLFMLLVIASCFWLGSVLIKQDLKTKVEKSAPAATPNTVAGEAIVTGVLRALPKSWYTDRTSVEI